MARTSLKQTILNAAAELIREEAGTKFTLEAVAERASVSKGGLLYHFPSKETLMEGLLENLLETIETKEREAEEELAGKTEAGHPLLMVLARLRASRLFRENENFNHALLTAAVTQKGVLEKVKPKFVNKLRRVSKDPEALILFLASEGLVFIETLGLNPSDEDPDFFIQDPLELLIKRTKQALRGESEL